MVIAYLIAAIVTIFILCITAESMYLSYLNMVREVKQMELNMMKEEDLK